MLSYFLYELPKLFTFAETSATLEALPIFHLLAFPVQVWRGRIPGFLSSTQSAPGRGYLVPVCMYYTYVRTPTCTRTYAHVVLKTELVRGRKEGRKEGRKQASKQEKKSRNPSMVSYQQPKKNKKKQRNKSKRSFGDVISSE